MSSYIVNLFIENKRLKMHQDDAPLTNILQKHIEKRRQERTCHHGDRLGKCDLCYDEWLNNQETK